MDNLYPLVSVIIPCRNEEKFIARCLSSVIAQDYSGGTFEIIVLDGMSTDESREIIRDYLDRYPNIRFFDNPQKITSCALNIGIANARGEFVLWMSAHNEYDKLHIRKCLEYMDKFQADAVGGIVKIRPRNNTVIGKAICLGLSSIFGVGSSLHKTGTERPVWADTAFGTCYKKEVFAKIGTFNEHLVRGQDMEFSLRMRKAGLKTLLAPDIISYYYARSDFPTFTKHNFSNGLWAIYPFKFTGHMPVSLRHLVPLVFILALILSSVLYPPLCLFILALYCLTNLYFSSIISFQQKDIRYLLIMPLVYFCLHFSYGLGSVWGGLKLFFSSRKVS